MIYYLRKVFLGTHFKNQDVMGIPISSFGEGIPIFVFIKKNLVDSIMDVINIILFRRVFYE